MPVPPIASIVIPTHDRAPRLDRALRALREQVVDGGFEVIVVDDASSDDTQAVLERWGAEPGFTLRLERLEQNRGPAVARNVGWRAASAPVVCFTDDDCVPHRDWVAQLLGALATADLAQGRTVPAPDQLANRGPFSHTMDVPHQDGHYATCNVAYRRHVLEGVGGFDEAFARPYGEDADLAWRAIDAGATTTFVAGAVVEHDVTPSSFRAHLADLRRREGLVHAVHNHPGLRAHLHYRGYARRTHPPLLALVVAGAWWGTHVTDPVALAAVAIAGAWYAWITRRTRAAPTPRWRWVPTVALAVVADLVEVAVLARASVRHRTVVL